MTRTIYFTILLAAGFVVSGFVETQENEQPIGSFADPVSFTTQVRPILSNYCFACHGPDAENRQADLRFDIDLDDVDFDDVLERITSTDRHEVMPPRKAKKDLSTEQIETLTQWIQQGAQHNQHWSFQKPTQPEHSQLDNDWSNQPIDQFVLARLKSQQLAQSKSADKRTLIRRVSLDLTGLPPSMDEVQTFLADDTEDAYKNLVDRMLAKPQYGEHMARFWLDLVRFADTNGLHHDHFRQMTPYRDWVIRSFNQNTPFDHFIVDQVAGDLHDEPTIDQQIASGFNRLHLIIDIGTALPEESFHRNVVDRVTAVGTAFMGLTVQCASCHDHKYDPIRQKDFYQLYAFFNNFDGGPETGGRRGSDFHRGLQPPYIDLPTEEDKGNLSRLAASLSRIEEKIKVQETKDAKAKAEQGTSKDETKSPESKDEKSDELKQLLARRDEFRKQRDEILLETPAALIMKERSEIRPTHILVRGEYDSPGELVERNVPGFLPPMPDSQKQKDRMDLARWLVDPANPLTARVTVNRIWQQFFGVGLVKTSEDFGSQGEPPSHPLLLDHLATQFVDSGWDVKSLVRSIVLSETYRQSSSATREQYLADPENRMLARGSRFRLDAETIRDQMLFFSELLNPSMHGKSVKPPQPAGLWESVAMPGSYPRVHQSDPGNEIYRRSVYTFWKRALPPPQMTIFDAPTRESCIARRERTNTPLQALMLMNEQQSFECAIHLARIINSMKDLSDQQRISDCWQRITIQEPDESTLQLLQESLDQFRTHYKNDPSAAKAMFAKVRHKTTDEVSDDSKQLTELAAWTMLVHSMFNLDITRTRQ